MAKYCTTGRGFAYLMVLVLALSVTACVTQSRLQPVSVAPMGQAINQAEPGWRALLISGDVSSPVFNNAVTASQELLVARGMSSSRITVLRSGPTHGQPALELQRIPEGFAEFRAQATDGCLVYITAHGTPHGLVIYTRSGPVVLPPATLAGWLSQACGSKPTVAILSGCFSGVYADQLPKADNRVIFTASRRDRTSFGCSKSGYLNAFDSCLLETLSADPTFDDLVVRTRACVAERERAAKVASSEPQAFVGASLAGVRLSGLPSSNGASIAVVRGDGQPTGTVSNPCPNRVSGQNRSPLEQAACE